MKKILDKLSIMFTLNFLKKLLVFLAVITAFICVEKFVSDNLDYINSLYFFNKNIFDFIIFVTIIIIVCKKLNLRQKFEQAVANVSENINASTEAKKESEKHLQQIEESISNIENEIDEIVKKAEKNATLIGKNLLVEAEKSSNSIKDNAEKAIVNSQNTLRNDLIKRASLASIEVAKSYIINELKNNKELHDKLIDESIEQIEGAEL